jgi:hypothetical protein
MKTYKIASEEGAQRYAREVGDEVELELNPDEERALIAAAWLEPSKKKEK